MLDFLMERYADQTLTQSEVDERQMRRLIRFTARTLETSSPVPFGAAIVSTATGDRLARAVNGVRVETDPSSHAELRTVRRATRRLGRISLEGYTLYSTCEPCPMCMANALWAGLDRVIYGATIEDANRHCRQIRIPAEEVVSRSDMRCAVDGPVMREASYALFTHPKMLEAFATWSARA